MEDQIIHIINGLAGLLEQLLDAFRYLADGKIEHVHTIHKHFKVVTDVAVFLFPFNEGLWGNRITHSGMDFELIISAAVGIEHESRIAIVTLLNKSCRSSVTIERPVHLVATVDNLGECLAIQQKDPVYSLHRGVGERSTQRIQVTGTT